VAEDQFKLEANFTITGPTDATITLQPVYTAMFPLQPVKFRIMEVDPASTSTIKNLRFSGADFPAGMGGAIYNAGNLTLEDCSVLGCKAASGGGIANFKTLAVKTSLIDGNQAPTGDGGGIYCAPVAGCVTTVTSSQVSNNQASKGGGLAVMTLAELIFNGGEVYHNNGLQGGGIYSSGGVARMTGGFLHSNSADDGGGLYNSGGTSWLTNVTVEGNTANNWGGGLWAKNGTTTWLTGCTFNGNSASIGGSKVAYTGTIDVTTFVNLSGCTGIVNGDREEVVP
jgi:hypothetical protein